MQAAFENYTNNANWVPDQGGFGFFAGGTEQQPMPGSSDGSFSFSNTPATSKST
jgi:hypothetical protein